MGPEKLRKNTSGGFKNNEGTEKIKALPDPVGAWQSL
jgi:hypothetical protein